ncbi:YkgJ family cysteine cluster protein [Caldivirga sp. UBA161]|uniref:YkgJ family cysteine cluster protein n=1 Tax=Caldivirga sp. UBA161 TaxID=1915569 RepID=UPI0025C00D65|nr:YkgJ family cysteine cluster protein [Caldivirga sp. UBA161]
MSIGVGKFTCLHCDSCCYFEREEQGPLVFSDEVKRLRRLAKERGVELTFREVKVNGVTMYRWVILGYCPFYDRGSKLCTIHAVKPLACKMYPLLFNPRTGEVVVSKDCPWVEEAVKNGGVSLSDFPEEAKALRRVVVRLSKGGLNN